MTQILNSLFRRVLNHKRIFRTGNPPLVIGIAPLAVACLFPGLASGGTETHAGDVMSGDVESAPGLWEGVPGSVKERSKWAFGISVGVIADSTPTDYLTGGFDAMDGPGEGYTYNLTVSYQIHEFDWRVEDMRFQPTLEIPFMFTLVDQKPGGIVPDVNLGLLYRWRDFPWNRFVYTTIGIGAGLSYSFDYWRADEERHPDEERSKFKFWGQLEVTFANPSYPEHQLLLFVDHQSGAHLFDDGGVDAFGLGYRHLF